MLSVDDLKPPRARPVDQDKGFFRPLGPTPFLLVLGSTADQAHLCSQGRLAPVAKVRNWRGYEKGHFSGKESAMIQWRSIIR